MINLMYVVLMAMLALNVSTDVLKGFSLVGNSLDRTITTTEQENKDLLDDLQAQYRKNPVKVQPWWDKAQAVQRSADSLCRYISNGPSPEKPMVQTATRKTFSTKTTSKLRE